MFFKSLLKRSVLAVELASIEGNAEAQTNLNVVEAEKKALIEDLDRVCDSVGSVNDELTNVREELLRIQAQIMDLMAVHEGNEAEGVTLELRIVAVSSTIDHLCEEFVTWGDQVWASIATKEDLSKCLLLAFPK